LKLILLRHGESEWNLSNQFTGWVDVNLTDLGIQEAQIAGNKLLEEKISINTINTSILNRAINTAKIVSSIISFNESCIKQSWRLNERHYGKLQGLNKSQTAKIYGEKQVHIWRRSFDIPPPKIHIKDKMHPSNFKKFAKIDKINLPTGESLSDVIIRLKPFWNNYIKEITELGGNHLIVAHSNSLRAILKILKNLTDKEITSVNIPTGIPLVIEIDKNKIIGEKYLIDETSLKVKQKHIANQGKIK